MTTMLGGRLLPCPRSRPAAANAAAVPRNERRLGREAGNDTLLVCNFLGVYQVFIKIGARKEGLSGYIFRASLHPNAGIGPTVYTGPAFGMIGIAAFQPRSSIRGCLVCRTRGRHCDHSEPIPNQSG